MKKKSKPKAAQTAKMVAKAVAKLQKAAEKTPRSILPLEMDQFVGKIVRLRKIGQKRESRVLTGQEETGIYRSMATGFGYHALVEGEYGVLRTSPIMKLIGHSATFVTFETEGGMYLMEFA